MYTSYGTKKYYEEKVKKAKLKEEAIKHYIVGLCSEIRNADAETLHCYSELIVEAEEAVKEAEKALFDFEAKEKTEKKEE